MTNTTDTSFNSTTAASGGQAKTVSQYGGGFSTGWTVVDREQPAIFEPTEQEVMLIKAGLNEVVESAAYQCDGECGACDCVCDCDCGSCYP